MPIWHSAQMTCIHNNKKRRKNHDAPPILLMPPICEAKQYTHITHSKIGRWIAFKFFMYTNFIWFVCVIKAGEESFFSFPWNMTWKIWHSRAIHYGTSFEHEHAVYIDGLWFWVDFEKNCSHFFHLLIFIRFICGVYAKRSLFQHLFDIDWPLFIIKFFMFCVISWIYTLSWTQFFLSLFQIIFKCGINQIYSPPFFAFLRVENPHCVVYREN